MAIGYTELNFTNGGPPPLSAANMNHIDEGVKACADALDSDASTSAKGVVQLASTGVESATKVPKATGAELVALLTAGGFSISPATGADNLDNIADGATYKRILAAIATALNAGTYDAAKCTAFGVGTSTPVAMVTSADNYTIGGLYTCGASTSITNAPFIDAGSVIFVMPYATSHVMQIGTRMVNVDTPMIKCRIKYIGTWGAWYEIFNAFSDGNGGQPPEAKSNKTSDATIGWFDVVDCASGASVTLPAGGTFEIEVLTYGATYNSVKTAIVAGGAMSGTASANLSMRYKRLTA